MPNPISFYRQRAGLSQYDLAAQSGMTLEYLATLKAEFSADLPRYWRPSRSRSTCQSPP